MSNIPVIRNYIERHVFECVYRGKDGKLYRPKYLGSVVFPNGSSWTLYSIKGVRYVTQCFGAKAFKPLASLEAADGVILLTAHEDLRLPLHAYLSDGDSIAKRQVLEAIATGQVVVEKPDAMLA